MTSFAIRLACTQPEAILELGSSFQTISAFFQMGQFRNISDGWVRSAVISLLTFSSFYEKLLGRVPLI
jgi:hypothetical protein